MLTSPTPTDFATEWRIPFLDTTVPIHWENHAVLMFSIWFVGVPLSVLILRFGKMRPTTYGIARGTPKWASPEFCWSLHFRLMAVAMYVSIAGAVFAFVVSGGFSGSLHAYFGWATVVLGASQIVSSWFRGSHGGRRAQNAVADDRSTWDGDHFDMTPQRWWFEACHKTAGYFTLFLAGGAVGTGLSQFWIFGVAAAFAVVIFVALIASILLQGRGHNHDTYTSTYGTHPENPFNKRRYCQMMDDQGKKP